MATSFPAPDEPLAPDERRLDTVAAQTEAIDALLLSATRQVLVFDRDLAQCGWSGALRAERLHAFLRRARNAEVRIVVHDTRHVEAACPRILALVRTYGHALSIWRTGVEARGANDALVIVDARHALHRYHVDQPRATLLIAKPQEVQPLAGRFEEIWATGEPAIGGTTLGL